MNGIELSQAMGQSAAVLVHLAICLMDVSASFH
jgi:hypothetical protein